MKFVIETRRPAPLRAFVSFAKPLTPVTACGGVQVNDRVASIWIGTYQDLVEMAELYCEVYGTRKV